MKKLKSVITIIIITVLTIITGCSDNIISPIAGNTGPETKLSITDRKLDNKTFHGKFLLKPRQVVTFNSGNTIFSSFKTISVMNCRSDKNPIEILGYMNDMAMVLDCNSKGFDAKVITIENKAKAAIELEVFLTGIENLTEEPPVKAGYEIE